MSPQNFLFVFLFYFSNQQRHTLKVQVKLPFFRQKTNLKLGSLALVKL
jgi:hypothetical protein